MKNAFNTLTSLLSFFIFFIICKRNFERSLSHFFVKRANTFFFCGIFLLSTCKSSIPDTTIKNRASFLYFPKKKKTDKDRKKILTVSKHISWYLHTWALIISVFCLWPLYLYPKDLIWDKNHRYFPYRLMAISYLFLFE